MKNKIYKIISGINAPIIITIIVLGGIAFLLSDNFASAYVLKGTKWQNNTITYYINPANGDMPEADAISSVQAGANSWPEQSGANINAVYAGVTNGTTVGNNGKNEVMFRQSTNGNAAATTYSYSSGDKIIDTDIVVWDGAFMFYPGDSGCSGGVYVTDIMAHEFGHAIGFNHSTYPEATMYSTIGYCSTMMRSLAQDDIDGAIAIYGPASGGPTPTATPEPTLTPTPEPTPTSTPNPTPTPVATPTPTPVPPSDLESPVVNFFDVQPRVTKGPITISWAFTDTGGSHLNRAEIQVAKYNSRNCSDTNREKCNWSTLTTVSAPSDLDSWSFSISTDQNKGTYWYGIHAVDNDGNRGVEPAIVRVTR